MESDADNSNSVNLQNSSSNKKNSFKLRISDKDGILLSIHHTVKNEEGEIRRIRFINACINKEFILAVNRRGHLVIFNLKTSQFWSLTSNILDVSVTTFIPGNGNLVLIGTKNGKIYKINIDDDEKAECIEAHDDKVISISFPNQKQLEMFLSFSKCEAKVFDYNLIVKHRLEINQITSIQWITTTQQNSGLKYSKYSKLLHQGEKAEDQIIGCVNDTVFLWKINFSVIRQFQPIKMRERFLKKNPLKLCLNVKEMFENDSESENEVNQVIRQITRENENSNLGYGFIKSVEVAENGRHFIVSCLDHSLILYSTTNWEIVKVINIADFYVQQIKFIKFMPEYKFLVVLQTSEHDLLLVNLEDLKMRTSFISNNNNASKCYKFIVSPNCKILANILKTGEILVHNLEFNIHVAMIKTNNKLHMPTKSAKSLASSASKIKLNKRLGEIHGEITKTLPRARLLPILKEFNEYPEKHRSTIWKTLQNLPQNSKAFDELLFKGSHPCVADYDERFSDTLDYRTVRNLKKIISCLAHWSSVFTQCDFIAQFVLPFLKVHPNDNMTCFETIATVLLNQCQLWFEFWPLEPYNYLGIIENVLLEFEPKLIEFYRTKNISSKIYALPENGFSELLDAKQWMQFFDHVISNPSYFLLFAICAYNSMQKDFIMQLENEQDMQYFFHNKNPIDMKKFVRKIYEIMEKCPPEIHPKNYMKAFLSLKCDHKYRKFENFPKLLLDMRNNEINALKDEENLLEMKIQDMEKNAEKLNERIYLNMIEEEQEKRLHEVEKKYEQALLEEEKRLASRRKLLLIHQRQLRERERAVLQHSKSSYVRRSTTARENELEMLLKTLEKNKLREESEMLFAEEDIKLREIELLTQKYESDKKMIDERSLAKRYEQTIQQVEEQKRKLNHQMNKISKSRSASIGSSRNSTCPSSLTNSSHNSDVESIKSNNSSPSDATETNGAKYVKYNVKDLEKKINYLENQVKILLGHLDN